MQVNELAGRMITAALESRQKAGKGPSVDQQVALVRRLLLDLDEGTADGSEELGQAVGVCVERNRELRGITRVAFAKSAGMSRPGVHALENGTAWPRRDKLVRIARTLGTTPYRILDPVYMMMDEELRGISDEVSFALLQLAATRRGVSESDFATALRAVLGGEPVEDIDAEASDVDTRRAFQGGEPAGDVDAEASDVDTRRAVQGGEPAGDVDAEASDVDTRRAVQGGEPAGDVDAEASDVDTQGAHQVEEPTRGVDPETGGLMKPERLAAIEPEEA